MKPTTITRNCTSCNSDRYEVVRRMIGYTVIRCPLCGRTEELSDTGHYRTVNGATKKRYHVEPA